MIPQTSREALIDAMRRFDRELRGMNSWSEWEQNQAHKYAIEWEEKRYPVKEIVSLATGAPVSDFSGGEEANSYVTSRGFSVARLRDETADTLRPKLEAILASYTKARNEQFAAHPIRARFRELQQSLEASDPIKKRPNVKVTWSAGQGNWARIPWVALLDRRETESTQQGVYCVFLFRDDMSGVYLTFNQGVTEPKQRLGANRGLEYLRSNAQALRSLCGALQGAGFKLDDQIDLRTDRGLASDYMAGTVAYKLYEAGSVLPDEETLNDLDAVLDAYDQYLASKAANTSRAWIFQANPKTFSLSAAIAELTELTWLVRQHSERIHAGDTAFVWESGDDARIVAVAKILTDPTPLASTDEEKKFHLDADKFEGEQLRVRLRIERRLAAPIRRQTLVGHPTLGSLQILKAPQGTNFMLTPQQAEALNALLGNGGITVAEAIESVTTSIAARGFVFEPWQVAAYITALRTKPFVILAGVSGTGKSKLPALVADATGGSCQLIPVRPDWTDSSDVLGYSDLEGRFRPGPLLELAGRAADQPSKHFVCIIDEMNLARVEHYFAEVLSRIEDRTASPNGGFQSGPLLAQSLREADAKWNSVFLPSNLALVGTVNMDESAHGFSRKVLDRAFTLEFSDVHLSEWESSLAAGSPTLWPVSNWFPRAIQLSGVTGLTNAERDRIAKIINELSAVNEILIQAQLQVGYRTRDEICLFVIHAQELAPSFITANGEAVDPVDLAFHMKILPRIAGGSGAIRLTVLQLLGWANAGERLETDEAANTVVDAWRKAGRSDTLTGARFPRTAARLCLMWDRLFNEGFTSFWL